MSARGCGVSDDRYMRFPVGFFDRSDDSPDDRFYGPERLVTHIDDVAIAAVGALYRELGLTGDVLDLMSSWISHFLDRPRRLTVLGMNGRELAANPMADERIVADLNTQPVLGFEDQSFDAAVCCVSVDYLVRPLELFDEAARVLRPGGHLIMEIGFTAEERIGEMLREWREVRFVRDLAGIPRVVCCAK